MKFSFVHPFRFCGDNARDDGWSSRLSTIVSVYTKHAGCVLLLLNCTDCYEWIRRKNLWLFVF